MIHLAAGALGGERRILALRTLIIEGAGTNPNVGQNRNPDDPLTDWEVTDYRKVIDLVRERMQVRQRRQAQFPFAMSNDLRQILTLDGNVALSVAADGNATRASEAVAKERRIELLGNPISAVRAALDPAAKLGRLHKEGAMQLVDVITPSGDHLTLAIYQGTHLPSSVRWLSASNNLGDIYNETLFLNYETVGGIKLPKRYLTKIDFRDYTTADIRVSRKYGGCGLGRIGCTGGGKASGATISPGIQGKP
jgi:hypothetical protein